MVIKMINNFEKEIDKVRNDIDKDISFFNNYLKKLSTQSKTEEEKEQLEQIKNNIRYAEDMIKWTKCKKESVREPSLEDINEREQHSDEECKKELLEITMPETEHYA